MQDYNRKDNLSEGIAHIEREESWVYINTDSIKQIHSGWKFYIPVTPEILTDTINLIKPLLDRFDIAFKYPASKKVLVKLNLGSYGWSQIGKNLVFYMPIINIELLSELSILLFKQDTRFPKVHHAIQLIKGVPIYYRYGNYHNLDSNDDRYNYDKKKIESSTISSLKEILKFEKDDEVDNFLLKYPVFDILSQSGKGGVFKSIDFSKEEFTEVITKVGYYLGGVQENGIDGKTLVLNEKKFVEKLKLKHLKKFRVPDILDFKINKNCSIVYEFIDGDSGVKKQIDNTLSLNDVKNCLIAILELHQNDVIWGDAKIGNFLWNKSGILYMLDFELSHNRKTKRICELRTFNLVNHNTIISPRDYDIIDFLVSILFDYKEDKQSRVDLQVIIMKKYSSTLKIICQRFLKETLCRIKEKRPTTIAIVNAGFGG